jgi:hypothetical protein
MATRMRRQRKGLMEYSDSHCASTIKEVIAHRGIKVTDQLRGGEGGAGTCALVPTVHQYGRAPT